MKKILLGLGFLLGLTSFASAQWQVTTGFLPKGRGAGVIGFGQSLIYDSGTRVGIATNAPGELLELKGTRAYLSLNRTAIGDEAGIQWLSAGSPKWYSYLPPASFDLRWNDGVADRMTFFAGGGLGINTTTLTTGARLDIQGAGAINHIVTNPLLYTTDPYFTNPGEGVTSSYKGINIRVDWNASGLEKGEGLNVQAYVPANAPATGAASGVNGAVYNFRNDTDGWGVIGWYNNDISVTNPSGVGVGGILRGAVGPLGASAGDQGPFGLMAVSEVGANHHPKAGLYVKSSALTNQWKTGLWVQGAIDYGLRIGTGDVQTTVPTQLIYADNSAGTVLFNVSASGNLFTNSTISAGGTISTPFAQGYYLTAALLAKGSGNYHQFYEPAGNSALALGNGTALENLYDNATHKFRSRAGGATTFVTISASGVALSGSSSGTATIAAQATAGTPTLTLPNASGTFGNSGTSPITLNATTGAIGCATCLTANQTITLSGDVTGSGSTAITTTLANIPSGVPMVGSLLATNIAAPSTPAAGKTSIYVDSTTKRLSSKNDAGTVAVDVVPDTGASNNFLTAISAAGVISRAQPAFSNLSGSVAASQMPALTGDVTTSAGAVATTLATVNANVGSFGSSTAIPSFTVNGKGLITAASTNVVIAPAGTLTGTTLASNVVTSSLTSLGTITSLTATTINAYALGGTISGGGNQINNVVIGASSPLAGTFTTLVGTGGTHTGLTSLGIRSTGAAFDLTIASTEVFTAGRALTITLNDAARTLNLGGNLTTAGAFTTSGAFAVTLTATATTNSTLPAGTHTLAGLDVNQTWSGTQTYGSGVLSATTPTLAGATVSGTWTGNPTYSGGSGYFGLYGNNSGSARPASDTGANANLAIGFNYDGVSDVDFWSTNEAAGGFHFKHKTGASTHLDLMFIAGSGLVSFLIDRAVRFDNQTSAAGANTGTLTNSPTTGNPGYWLKINIGGTNYAIPAWAG